MFSRNQNVRLRRCVRFRCDAQMHFYAVAIARTAA